MLFFNYRQTSIGIDYFNDHFPVHRPSKITTQDLLNLYQTAQFPASVEESSKLDCEKFQNFIFGCSNLENYWLVAHWIFVQRSLKPNLADTEFLKGFHEWGNAKIYHPNDSLNGISRIEIIFNLWNFQQFLLEPVEEYSLCILSGFAALDFPHSLSEANFTSSQLPVCLDRELLRAWGRGLRNPYQMIYHNLLNRTSKPANLRAVMTEVYLNSTQRSKLIELSATITYQAQVLSQSKPELQDEAKLIPQRTNVRPNYIQLLNSQFHLNSIENWRILKEFHVKYFIFTYKTMYCSVIFLPSSNLYQLNTALLNYFGIYSRISVRRNSDDFSMASNISCSV
jgi:hypothetical protein